MIGPTPRVSPASRGIPDLRARQPHAVHSALTVLEEVARCGPGVTAQQVSANLSMPRATTYRLINLLVQDEYLVRMPDLQGFALGRKVVELAHLVEPGGSGEEQVSHPSVGAFMTPSARSLVRDFRQGVRGGVHVVGYGTDGMFVADADPDFPLTDERRLLSDYGVSAVGRLLLAEGSSRGDTSERRGDRPVDARPGGGGNDSWTGKDGADGASSLVEVRRTGRSWQVDSFSHGFGCLALPIRRPDGLLIGGIALSAPRVRIEAPGSLVADLESAARRLAPLLASPIA